MTMDDGNWGGWVRLWAMVGRGSRWLVRSGSRVQVVMMGSGEGNESRDYVSLNLGMSEGEGFCYQKKRMNEVTRRLRVSVSAMSDESVNQLSFHRPDVRYALSLTLEFEYLGQKSSMPTLTSK
ncbi:unnamed protein product [Sphenostylis stenocarpa]|uniref:Uncharacterized protein n=1 Tax=Sphenostylis stenocarpa TaxID=92480 RepID=A0AA86S3G7_9FABA|nr:unnamed protein product [Sphenostylis stenocarpa]